MLSIWKYFNDVKIMQIFHAGEQLAAIEVKLIDRN